MNNIVKWGVFIGWVVLLSSLAYGDHPDTLWTRTYGGPDHDDGYCVIVTTDSCFAIAAMTESYGEGEWDAYILKTDFNGNLLWETTFGGASLDLANHIKETPDGGFIVSGWTMSFGNGVSDGFLLKLDEEGNIEWYQIYDGGGADYLYSVELTDDGGYIAVGYTNWVEEQRADVLVIRTDSLGTPLWVRHYSCSDKSYGRDIIKTEEGYLIAGSVYSQNEGYNALAMLIDDSGNIVWEQSYGGAGSERVLEVIKLSKGGYALTGRTTTDSYGETDVYLLRIDDAGCPIFERHYGGANYDNGYGIAESQNGGFVIVGYTKSYGAGDFDIYIIRTDWNGDTLWTAVYGGPYYEIGCCIIELGPSSYLIVGSTESFGAGCEDVYLLRLEELPTGISIHDFSPDKYKLNINYAERGIKVNYSLPADEYIELSVLGADGRVVRLLRKGYEKAGVYTLLIPFSNSDFQGLASGVYILRLKTPRNILRERFIFVR